MIFPFVIVVLERFEFTIVVLVPFVVIAASVELETDVLSRSEFIIVLDAAVVLASVLEAMNESEIVELEISELRIVEVETDDTSIVEDVTSESEMVDDATVDVAMLESVIFEF